MEKISLESYLNLITNEYYRGCSFKYLEILKQRGFDEAPASRNIHHFYKGGLRAHTEEMLDIGMTLYVHEHDKLNEIDLDELIIATAFHDAGKADLYILYNGEYIHNENSRSTVVDHSFVPIEDWLELGFTFSSNICDAILGHMGGWSRTNVYPNTLLASVVASADLISSRIGKIEW